MPQSDVDAISSSVLRRLQDGLLRRMAIAELQSDEVWRSMAQTVREHLRVENASRQQVEAVLRLAFEKAIDEQIPIIRQQIIDAAKNGNTAAMEQFRLIFGEGAASELPFADGSASSRRARPWIELASGSEDD